MIQIKKQYKYIISAKVDDGFNHEEISEIIDSSCKYKQGEWHEEQINE